MLHRYINLLLTLLLPVSILSIIISIIFLTAKFEFLSSVKLGILAGIISGICLSALLALVLLRKKPMKAVPRSDSQTNMVRSEPTTRVLLRRYINLFLTLLMPVSMLSAVVAIILLSLKFEFNESIRLGVVTGVAAGICLSALLTIFLLTKRQIQSIMQEVETEIPVASEGITSEKSRSGEEGFSFILFMDNVLAFETSVYTIQKNLIGDIIGTDEKKGTIDIKDAHQDAFRLNIQPLTTHTSIVKIETHENSPTIENIYYALKGMDNSYRSY